MSEVRFLSRINEILGLCEVNSKMNSKKVEEITDVFKYTA